MGLTRIEKIASGSTIDDDATQGSVVTLRPLHIMTHDNTSAVMKKFLALGAERMADPNQPVFALDHDIQNRSLRTLSKYREIDTFAHEHGIDFYPAGAGISHQIMIEEGYVKPGTVVVGSDSHSPIYGALGALGVALVRTDAATIWATGRTWWSVPPIVRCRLVGSLPRHATAKDVVLTMCGELSGKVHNLALEFEGDGVAQLSMDGRMAIANMATEAGALAAVFPEDDTLWAYLEERAAYFRRAHRPGRREKGSRGDYTDADVKRWKRASMSADTNAHYAIEIEIRLDRIAPYVAGPNDVATWNALPDLESRRVAIDKAYLLSCVGGRYEDFERAAEVIRGKTIASGVDFYIAAASAATQRRLEQSGHWQILLDAGAIALPAGCGPCIGLGKGLVEDGEVAISATNRNFPGRMGSRHADVYLASPAVVAASAIEGRIVSPENIVIEGPAVTVTDVADSPSRVAPMLEDGFPLSIEGRALLLPTDRISTDEIYAGRWTYQDDMSAAQMAAVAFENYDAGFSKKWRPGDILLAGNDFGRGSSREQAVTALQHKGIGCIIAASFSETYKRNATNNGYLLIECGDLVRELRATLPKEAPPTVSLGHIRIDFPTWSLVYTSDGDESRYEIAPIGATAQRILAAGGLAAMASSSRGVGTV